VPNKIAFTVSLVLYGLSLLTPAFYLKSGGNWPGFGVLLVGPLGALDGIFAWYANPLLWLSVALLRWYPKVSRIIIVLGFMLAATTFNFEGIDSSMKVRSFGSGTYLWLASFIAAFWASFKAEARDENVELGPQAVFVEKPYVRKMRTDSVKPAELENARALALIKLEKTDKPLKRVYQLQQTVDVESAPLSQNARSGQKAVFGEQKTTSNAAESRRWWDDIRRGRKPLLFISGTIVRAYIADASVKNAQQPLHDTVDLKLEDGSIEAVRICADDVTDLHLFQPDHWVSSVYALDELKGQLTQEGGLIYSRTTLEMAVSLEAKV
jgi:hypothetical protein